MQENGKLPFTIEALRVCCPSLPGMLNMVPVK